MNAPFLRCLALVVCCLSLGGCFWPRTLYYHGEASGVVVDALTRKPIPQAVVSLGRDEKSTDSAGAFRMAEKTGWEFVVLLAERGLLDYPGERYMIISAPGYQKRGWSTPYDAVYPFPIMLLPENCGLRYKTACDKSEQGIFTEIGPDCRLAEPTVDETFPPQISPKAPQKDVP